MTALLAGIDAWPAKLSVSTCGVGEGDTGDGDGVPDAVGVAVPEGVTVRLGDGERDTDDEPDGVAVLDGVRLGVTVGVRVGGKHARMLPTHSPLMGSQVSLPVCGMYPALHVSVISATALASKGLTAVTLYVIVAGSYSVVLPSKLVKSQG